MVEITKGDYEKKIVFQKVKKYKIVIFHKVKKYKIVIMVIKNDF